MNNKTRTSEQGGARLKFVIVVAIIGAIAYSGYLLIPVAYQSYQLKDLMQHDVDVAVTKGKPTSWVRDQLVKNSVEYGIPPDALIEPLHQDNRMQVRVYFKKPIEFPGYVYDYEFDYTARSAAFLSLK